MGKIKEDITIFALGDHKDYDSFRKFNKERKFVLDNGFQYASCDYGHFLAGRIPPIATEKVIVFFFFPFLYWNKNIEKKGYKGIYGNRTFYTKFNTFWNKVNSALNKYLPDKKLFFISDPKLCGLCRDKLSGIKKFSPAGISQPRLYRNLRGKAVLNLLERGVNLFLKPRYGSMGKGITFLSWANWQTNFVFKNGKILNRHSDHGWKFRDITGNRKFLNSVLRKGILIEKAVDSLCLKRMKVDMRMYSFLNKVIYVYPRKNRDDRITTNISQGASGDPKILDFLPKRLVSRAKKLAAKAAQTLGVSLAGVDVMIDRNLRDIYVLDVNLFPGFPKRRTFNLAQKMIIELSRLRKKGEIRFEESRSI